MPLKLLMAKGFGFVQQALINANLSSADLSGANLIHSNLSGANLHKAKLYRSNLAYATLKGTNLRNADLRDANLAGTDLTDADLDKVNLEGTSRSLAGSSNKSNQTIKTTYEWNGFYFRSKTEIKIAKALDRAGVLFYPNCKARLKASRNGDSKDTDFLIFYQGKWGILEVDGELGNPTVHTVYDHERDRLFKLHGIPIVEHYDVTQCEKQPERVVQEFLDILKRA